MRKLFNQYGLALLVCITGAIILSCCFSILSNSKLFNQYFLTSKDQSDIAVANQEAVEDSTIYTDNWEFEMDLFDVVLEYGENYDFNNYISTKGCTDKCFSVKAYSIDKDKNRTGSEYELSDFLTYEFIDEAGVTTPFDSSKSGAHLITYTLRWNGYNVKTTKNIYVKENPNIPDLTDKDLLNNMVKGTLVDEEQKGLAETRIRLIGTDQDGNMLSFDTVTSKSGSFVFYGMPKEQDYAIVVVGYEDTAVTSFYYEGGDLSIGQIKAVAEGI